MTPDSAIARWLPGVLLVGLVVATAATGEESRRSFVSEALARPIIGPRQVLAEVADYCETAVPTMPAPKSVADWEAHVNQVRADVFERVIYRGEAAAWRDARVEVEWLGAIPGGPGYRIRTLRYEAVPGLWIPALLYEPEHLEGKVPLILNVNGHDSKGKAADYKQVRCINQAKRGMIALNVEWIGMGQLADGFHRHDLINHIDLCGTSGIATHYLAMKRAIDLLLGHKNADPTRLAVTGLSGGGWQTIFISAFEPRVGLSNPVAGYSSFRTRARHFSDLGDSEQTPCDLATVTDYAEMTAMLAPRPALLTYNARDNCCFASGHALPPLLDAAAPIYALYGQRDHLRSHINEDPGTHNYLRENREANYRMLGDHFHRGDPGYRRTEIDSDSEVKDAKALDVPLPEGRRSLHDLALGLSKSLPGDAALPGDREGARAWRERHREGLRRVVRAKRYDVEAKAQATREAQGIRETDWRLKAGEWSVPVVELAVKEPKAAVLILSDAGRQQEAPLVESWLGRGHRVLAVDPFYVGESKVSDHDYLFALLLAAVGDRPLGLQAGEIAAVARWAKSAHPGEPLTIVASGPRCSVMALVAAAIEPKAIDGLELRKPLGSLKELIESTAPYTNSPELFCFGLLHEADVRQLVALAAPRKVAIVDADARGRKELAGLKSWYEAWGADWEPLR